MHWLNCVRINAFLPYVRLLDQLHGFANKHSASVTSDREVPGCLEQDIYIHYLSYSTGCHRHDQMTEKLLIGA